ncbi:YitT family protein [Salibaculum sp.]|uniref:YitT family protein n=1 Tax=Salibaculum sp. TaxID=2855480 RepID=UPI002B46E9D4|nr:YitT family protein [Salibaculum sp.]HKL45633.1 YitT family protein [Roseovarius sp.]HKL70269.1 YitT family protein [Salibaculum sp.]
MAQDIPTTPHSTLEDAQAFALGTAMCALGITMLTHLGLITGQTAGLAVLLSYVTGWSFGPIFFVLNLPFYWLGWVRLGRRFVVKSLVCVTLLSVMAETFPGLVRFDQLDPVLGALLIGGVTGLGLIVIFRHGASLGGVGVLGLVIQDRTGFRAGYVQLAFDVALFAAAFAIMEPRLVLFSLAGAVVANLIIATNHRHDRYTGR